MDFDNIKNLPTIFISINQQGDVFINSNQENFNTIDALGMLELAKLRLMTTHFQTVLEEKKRAQAMASIIVPNR